MLDAEPRTAVLVTHDVEEALLLGQRVAVLSPRPGRVAAIFEVPGELAEGSRREILRRPGFASLRDEVLPVLEESGRTPLRPPPGPPLPVTAEPGTVTSAYPWDPPGAVLAGVGVPGGGTTGVLALTGTHGDVVGQFTAAGTAMSGPAGYGPWGSATGTSGAMAGKPWREKPNAGGERRR